MVGNMIKCKFNVGDTIEVANVNGSYLRSSVVEYLVDHFGQLHEKVDLFKKEQDMQVPKCIVTRTYPNGAFEICPIQNKLTNVIPVPKQDGIYFKRSQ